MMRLTSKEVAEKFDIKYTVAAGIMSLLQKQGQAKVVEKRFHPSGKGQPIRVYEVNPESILNFREAS
jgi:transcription initiation factor IIE alpha subunit